MIAFGCSPIKKSWTPDILGVCLGSQAMNLTREFLILILEILIRLLPLPLLWKLQLRFNQKMLVNGVFFSAICKSQPRVRFMGNMTYGLSL